MGNQIDAVQRAIQPLDPLTQHVFVAALNNVLGDRLTIGDGELFRMLREFQRKHIKTYPKAQRS